MLIIIDDFNAMINASIQFKRKTNENGVKLCNYAAAAKLIINNTKSKQLKAQKNMDNSGEE